MILAACALLLVPWPATSAGPAQEVRVRRTSRSLLRELRRSEDFVERGAVAEALIAKGRDGQKKLVQEAVAQLRDLEDRFDDLRGKRWRRAADLARDWRVGEPSQEELDAVAKARLVIARIAKEEPGRVSAQGELDRALGLLSLRLEAGLDAVLGQDPDLARTAAGLEEIVGLAVEFRRYWASAVTAIEESGGDAAWLKKSGEAPDPSSWRAKLRADLARARRVAWRLDSAGREVLAANRDAAERMRPEEREVVQEINRLRYLAGATVLRIVPGLNRACRNHAEDMLALGFNSHDSPVKGRESFWQRAEEEGVQARNENLNQGSWSAEEAVVSWWRSYGHRRAILGPYREIGVAHRGLNWVCLFN